MDFDISGLLRFLGFLLLATTVVPFLLSYYTYFVIRAWRYAMRDTDPQNPTDTKHGKAR